MSEPELNHKVYQYAHSQMRQHVGRGECWDLVDAALRYAGAVRNAGGGDEVDYVWGTEIGPHQTIAGDVVQLRNYEFVVKTVTRVEFDDGEFTQNTKTESTKRPHHTAIVDHYTTKGLVIIEQNYPKGSKVTQNTLPLSNFGPITETSFVSRKDAKGKMRPAKVSVTTTVEVSGRIWAYRPKASESAPKHKGKQ